MSVFVFYDGLCHLCSREIDHYKSMRGSDNIQFIDITSPSFDAHKEGLDPIEVNRTMHVRDRAGHLHLGVDAFITIWQELPALKFLVPIARNRFVYAILKYVYLVFAKIRPWLPRKSCASSPYCETKRN